MPAFAFRKIYHGTASAEGITITWDAVPNANAYLVYRFTSAGVISLLEKTSETRYVDKSAQEPGIYSYKVISSDGDALSAVPLENLIVSSFYKLSGELAVPRNFKAKAGNTAVTLTWSKAKNAKEYTIYRATTANGLYTKLATVEAVKFVDKMLRVAIRITTGYEAKMVPMYRRLQNQSRL